MSAVDDGTKQWAVWKDPTYGFAYGTREQAEGKEVVDWCSNYDEARITWKIYYHVNP